MKNCEKQARFREYRALAIKWYEKKTGMKIKDVVEILKLAEEEKSNET